MVPLAGNDSLVGCVYRSPSSVTSTSTHQLCRLLESVTFPSTHLLVCGDFNYSIALIGQLVVAVLPTLVRNNSLTHYRITFYFSMLPHQLGTDMVNSLIL